MKRYNYPKWGLVLILTIGVMQKAQAEESVFGYIYTTDLLPAGAKEAEQWLTWRHNKSQGTFDVLEGRTSVEYGVTDKFQVAVYANYVAANAFHNNIDGTSFAPESFADYQYGPDDHFRKIRFQGFSFEAIYRLLSPYTDPVGLAVYVEPTVGHDLYELESRIIVQKNFLDDRLVIAANVTMEQEGRYLSADPTAAAGSGDDVAHWDKETDVNLSIGASYRFAPKWTVGFELENEREFSAFSIADRYRTNQANYIGPNIHYGGKDFFVTATFLEQIGGARDYANSGASSFVVGGRNYADDFEKYRLRIKAGFYF